MASDSTLFVLYSPHENKSKDKNKKAKDKAKDESKAKRVPPKWWYVGGGGTSDPRFPREEQFSGPHSTLPAMRAYLTREFDARTTKKQSRGTRSATRTRIAPAPAQAHKNQAKGAKRSQRGQRAQKGKRAQRAGGSESSGSSGSTGSTGSSRSGGSSGTSSDSADSDWEETCY